VKHFFAEKTEIFDNSRNWRKKWKRLSRLSHLNRVWQTDRPFYANRGTDVMIFENIFAEKIEFFFTRHMYGHLYINLFINILCESGTDVMIWKIFSLKKWGFYSTEINKYFPPMGGQC
jgi:hypothetical protein